MNNTIKAILVFMLLSLSTSFAIANNDLLISVENPFVREMPPTAMATAGFMTLHNASNKDIYLVKAAADISKIVELHTHKLIDGMMKMREVKSIKIPAKGSTQLKPGGLHVMFIGLNTNLTTITNVTFKLYFDNGEEHVINAPTKSVMMPMRKM